MIPVSLTAIKPPAWLLGLPAQGSCPPGRDGLKRVAWYLQTHETESRSNVCATACWQRCPPSLHAARLIRFLRISQLYNFETMCSIIGTMALTFLLPWGLQWDV